MEEKNISDLLKNDYNLDLLEIVVPSGDSFSMYITPRFTLSYVQGYEKYSTRIVKNVVKKCDLFIDVGAHYGYYSLLVADANKSVKIIAIEPIDENFEVLKKNLIHNNIGPQRVKCIKAAVSSISGRTKFYKSEASDNSSILPHPHSGTLECIDVDAIRLDDILEKEQYKSLFIKTDTDGNELEVLKSLSSTYDQCDDITILLELNPKMLKLAGSSCEEILEYLKARDFKIYAIDDNEFRYYPLDVKGNLEMMCSIYETSYFNVLCIKEKNALSVVFFSHSSGLAGAERSMLDLIRGLLERKVLCTVVLPNEGKLINLLKEAGCGVFVLPEKVRAKISWWWCSMSPNFDSNRNVFDSYRLVLNHILPELKKINPDITYSQTIVSPWGAVCAGLLNIPHVLSVREYGIRDYHLHFYYGFEKSMYALYKASEDVFCITNDVKNILFGSDEEQKTSVIYSQVQVDDINEKMEANKYNDVFNSNWESGISVGLFGTIIKGKGQEDIVRACIELCRAGYNLKCILAGYVSDNEFLKNLDTLIEQSGFSDHFIRYDFTDKPYELMKNTDIIVSCSQMEALGRTLLEAILLQKPFIYANAGGPKEIFTDQVHGLAYETGDFRDLAKKILLTVNNIEETRDRINTAREYITKKFNPETLADKTYKILRALKEKVLKNNNHSVAELIYGSMAKDTSGILLKPRLYYSKKANDFSEHQYVLSQKIPFGLFSVFIPLPKGEWRYFRFDPTEEYNVELKIYKIVVATATSEILINPDAKIYSNGIEKNKQFWSFFHLDPQVIINLDVDVKEIEIMGELIRIDKEEIIEKVRRELKSINIHLDQKNDELKQKNDELKQKNEELKQKNEELKQKNEELKQKNEEINYKNKEINHKEGELKLVNNQMLTIKKSLAYKFSKAIFLSGLIFRLGKLVDSLNNHRDYRKINKLLRQNGLFDKAFYLQNNPDVKAVGVNPLKHYCNYGWKEGRDPSRAFNTHFYLTTYEDVKDAGINPLIHFINFGKDEGRSIQAYKINEDPCFIQADIRDFDQIETEPFDLKIAVVCHLFYFDLAEEFITYFNNIPGPYDLFITTSLEKEESVRELFAIKLPDIKITILATENKGRDIAPFIDVLKTHLMQYDLVCKVHTKKSGHDVNLEDWRKYLLDQLLGNSLIIRKIISEFIHNKQLGIVWPVAHPYLVSLGLEKGWGPLSTRDKNYKIACVHFPELPLNESDQDFTFPLGSMFWFRPETLSLFVHKNINLNHFEIEDGQIDGTLAHSCERLFGLIVRRAGFESKTAFFPQNQEELTQTLSSRSWRFTKPFRFIISIPVRIYQKIISITTTSFAIVKVNGGLWNTTKKVVRIIRKEGFRMGNFRYHVKYQSRNAKDHKESKGDKIYIAYSDRNENLSDTIKSTGKRDETIFHSTSSILFIGHDARLAGAQVLLLSLIKWFTEHTGITVKVLLLEKEGILFDQYKKICPVLVWKELVYSLTDYQKREAAILEFTGKIDLIYGNTVIAPSVYDELKFLNAPYITHVHELEKSIKMYVDKNTIKKMHLFTDCYIAGSSPVCSNLLLNHCSDEGKIIIINDFIEKREINFDSSKKYLREKLALISEGMIIFGCGSVYWRKGVDLFIETASILKEKGLSDFHLYWIGENVWDQDEASSKINSWNTFEQKIEYNDLGNHITFLGVKENFFDYFMVGDIFYLPSREDPFPLVCLEAAQASLPIICFEDAGGMPDFVENDAGFVVPFEDVNAAADKIILLYKNPDILHEYGVTASKKFLERHSIDIAAPQILNFCRKTGNFSPAVSVIVPNYNYEKYLEKRLSSILNQTFQDFEIIILDDASTDGSLEIINKFSLAHEAQIIINKNNGSSVFKQWYKGLSVAKGDFVWMAEADDLSDHRFLEKMMPFMNDENVNLAYCNSKVIDESGKVHDNFYDHNGHYENLPGGNKWNRSYICQGDVEMDDGLGIKNTIPNASAVLLRRSSLLNVNQDELFSFRCAGDWYVYISCLRYGKIAYNAEQLNYHRRHSQSVVGRSINSAEETVPDYYKIHKYVIKYFHINEMTLYKQMQHVLVELRAIWPNVTDEEYKKLYDTNELKRIYNFTKISNITNSNPTSDIEIKVHPKDEMYLFFTTHPDHKNTALQSYYASGARMLQNLLELVDKIGLKIEETNSFLEFACGYGRFTRHLVKIIHPQKITGSDVYKEAVDFQKEVFGVKGFYSEFNPDDVTFPEKYDMIFVASLFSHLPLKTWHPWLKKLYQSLNENGVLIFSTHGKSCMANPDEMPDNGFCYMHMSDTKIHSFKDYTTTYVTSEFVHRAVLKETGQIVLLEVPKGLGNYQDVFVVRKTEFAPINQGKSLLNN